MTPADFNVEKTTIGLQYVIPGTEQAAKPKRRVYKRDGLQLVIPGAERISTKEYIARMSEKPITPRKGQIGLQGTALFGRVR